MTTLDLSAAEAIIQDAVPRVAPAAQLAVRWRGALIHARAYGWLDPETRQLPTRLDTLFDLASVTKLFAVTAFMILVEAGLVTLDQPVARVLPELIGVRPVQPYEDPLAPGGFVSVTDEAAPVDVGLITF